VVVDTPGFPSPQSAVGIETLRMSDDLADYLVERGDAVAVLGFGTLASKPMNQASVRSDSLAERGEFELSGDFARDQ
jgi:hypothetical protein